MPQYDGTGPRGQGPMTGRGMGFCVMRVNENQPQADSPSRPSFARRSPDSSGGRDEGGSAMAQHGPPAGDNLSDVKGFVGIQGKIISDKNNIGKGVNKMPGGDGTGPLGMGPMTGRAAGFCAGYGMPGYMNPIPGRGSRLRQGYGGQVGMGRGRGFWGRGRGGAWGGMPYGAPYAAPYGAPYAMPYGMPYANI